MIKKTQKGYVDIGPGHCGQFSSDFHATGKYRYMDKKKRKRTKDGITAFFSRKIKFGILNRSKDENVEVKLDPVRYRLLSKIISINSHKK